MRVCVCVSVPQVDRAVVKRIPSYDGSLLGREIAQTQKIKGRLLYYYPTDEAATAKEDAWIGSCCFRRCTHFCVRACFLQCATFVYALDFGNVDC